MENCVCGVPRKKFWLWRDTNGGLHASGFAPSAGLIRTVVAASVRDALLPVSGAGRPKHAVADAEDPSVVWDGRCSLTATSA